MTGRRRVAVVTGSRAEYGLLQPVMHAIHARDDLELLVVVTGTHLLGRCPTIHEVRQVFNIAATIEMQHDGEMDSGSDRAADAEALGRGIAGIGAWLRKSRPDVVLVLGDRIEAFAAASAASVGGIAVAHLHGGDRAEGVADEAMRHAITKLAHLHLPATRESADRVIAMGECKKHVHVVGSPAIDGLADAAPIDDGTYERLGAPEFVVMHHPIGRNDETEREDTVELLTVAREHGRVLAMMPNHDPGRSGIVQAIEDLDVPRIDHMPREQFIGLLRRAKGLVGNSSAGLIEAAALGVWAINVGDRQAGRQRSGNVIDVTHGQTASLHDAFRTIENASPPRDHPYGDGRAGQRVAEHLATLDLNASILRKRNTY